MPRIPLIEDLAKGPIPPGYNLLLEFDPASEWYSASITIAAGWISTGGEVSYSAYAQPPETVRGQLMRLGLNVEELESSDRLRIYDYYTVTLGQKSKEKHAVDSLKVADLSIRFAKTQVVGPLAPNRLRIADTVSTGTRFNDEKAWFEFRLTRVNPMGQTRKSTLIFGLTMGVHSEWAYKTQESAVDGIIDFRLDDTVDPARNVIRIRRLREIAFDGHWHNLKLTDNFQVVLDK